MMDNPSGDMEGSCAASNSINKGAGAGLQIRGLTDLAAGNDLSGCGYEFEQFPFVTLDPFGHSQLAVQAACRPGATCHRRVVPTQRECEITHNNNVRKATGSLGIYAHARQRPTVRGYARMLGWARQHAPGRRFWALEGTGIFAAGLAGELALAGRDFVEVGALKRARGSKKDRLDAIRAARTVLAREHQPSPPVGELR